MAHYPGWELLARFAETEPEIRNGIRARVQRYCCCRMGRPQDVEELRPLAANVVESGKSASSHLLFRMSVLTRLIQALELSS